MSAQPQEAGWAPALRRLCSLARLDPEAAAALDQAVAGAASRPVRSQLVAQEAAIDGPRLIVGGWAARTRLQPDGRRALLSLLLPGDLIGLCRHQRPLALSNVVALTEVAVCAVPRLGTHASLDRAYAISEALEQHYLLAQINRLGSFSAQERIIDFVLELAERLSLAGLANGDRFDFPLTQEQMGEVLGLSPVHINRTVQILRRSGFLVLRNGQITIADLAERARQVGWKPAKVSARA